MLAVVLYCIYAVLWATLQYSLLFFGTGYISKDASMFPPRKPWRFIFRDAGRKKKKKNTGSPSKQTWKLNFKWPLRSCVANMDFSKSIYRNVCFLVCFRCSGKQPQIFMSGKAAPNELIHNLIPLTQHNSNLGRFTTQPGSDHTGELLF